MATGEIWTVGKLLKWTEQYFTSKGLDSPRLDAEVLLSHVLKKERIYLYVHFDEPLETAELSSYRELIKKRLSHEPIAYIIGEREFMGLTFKVTPDTLVPRPDTEILVEAAMGRLKKQVPEKGENLCIADIGTGTGAIILSLLKFLPAANGMAVDISPEAIAVAEENAAEFALTDRVKFFCGDLLTPLEGQRFNAIISNPPYIPTSEMNSLMPEVRSFEPRLALDGGADGLDFYRRLLAESTAFLMPKGFLAVEIGLGQAPIIISLVAENKAWGKTEIVKDLAGIERVTIIWLAENV